MGNFAAKYGSISCHFRDEPVKKQRYSDDDDDFDEQERERLRDLKERDEFADRMKDKDKGKTRQIMSKSEKKVRIFKKIRNVSCMDILCTIRKG